MFHIVVEPRSLGNLGAVHIPDSWCGTDQEDIDRRYRERCEEIIEEIKRHCNNVGSCSIVEEED